MEEEYIFTGYCRSIDASRMVTVETDGIELLDVACDFDSCPYEKECTIAAQIKRLQPIDA